MPKIIAAINITIDGYCDHTAGIADEELHQHYADLLHNAGVLLYGRTTYQLMQYWQELVKNPSGEPAMDEFARVMDKTPKIVLSTTLRNLDWHSAELASDSPENTAIKLRQELDKDIFIGSPGLISELTGKGLVDEFQLCIHPVIIGSGLPLFKHITERIILDLVHTKHFASGAFILYYQPKSKGR